MPMGLSRSTAIEGLTSSTCGLANCFEALLKTVSCEVSPQSRGAVVQAHGWQPDSTESLSTHQARHAPHGIVKMQSGVVLMPPADALPETACEAPP